MWMVSSMIEYEVVIIRIITQDISQDTNVTTHGHIFQVCTSESF